MVMKHEDDIESLNSDEERMNNAVKDQLQKNKQSIIGSNLVATPMGTKNDKEIAKNLNCRFLSVWNTANDEWITSKFGNAEIGTDDGPTIITIASTCRTDNFDFHRYRSGKVGGFLL